MSASGWSSPPTGGMEAGEGVDVWRIALTETRGTAGRYVSLSMEEQARAERLLIPAKQAQFLQTRRALRLILARYLQTEPGAIPILEAVPHRKPFVPGPGGPLLQFNLSHCDGMALVAVSRRRRVGVDVERVDGARPLREIAARFFHPGEREILDALDGVGRVVGFYRLWTAKEALLKATGHGLHHPLDSFALDMETGAVAGGALPEGEHAEWTVQSLDLGPGYAAAVAAEYAGWAPRLLAFEDQG